jgi:hypothetical protein
MQRAGSANVVFCCCRSRGSGAGAPWIFVACAFLLYLPQLETFKAFGIEARMQKNLVEAKEILEKVRQALIASAKSAYLNSLPYGELRYPQQNNREMNSEFTFSL